MYPLLGGLIDPCLSFLSLRFSVGVYKYDTRVRGKILGHAGGSGVTRISSYPTLLILSHSY